MKVEVKWTVTGSYEVDNVELGVEESDNMFEEMKGVIYSSPYEGIDIDDGKVTLDIQEVK